MRANSPSWDGTRPKQLQFALAFDTKIKTELSNEKSLKPPPFQFQLEYKLSEEEQALSSQAQWYVYSQQHVPKSTFEDPYFNNMTIFQVAFGGGTKGQKIPTTHKTNAA